MKAKKYSVTLYPRDVEALQRVAAQFPSRNGNNLSQALRYIISEWIKEQNHDGTNDCTAVTV